MIQTFFLLIHVFNNDTTYTTECHDPQYQKPSEGKTKIPHAKLSSSRAFIIASVRFNRKSEVE